DGKSVTVEDVRPMVEEIVRGTCEETAKRALEELPQLVRGYMADNPPPAGPKGDKGDPGADAPAVDVDALREEITRTVRDDLSAEARDELPQLVRAYLSENPPAAGPKGDPGPKGE